jgi:phosphoglycolate phosphatase-like HAD superfamily hydrolase
MLQHVSELSALVAQARLLVFDFDGTLVDSNPIKRRAFAHCFAGFPDRLEEILAYCNSQHRTPRGEKFRHVYERILRLPYTAAVASVLHERFEAATTEQIIRAPEIPGAEAFLRRVAQRHVTALLSTTPHDVLLTIVARRGWQALFGRVQGAPVQKATWLRAVRRGLRSCGRPGRERSRCGGVLWGYPRRCRSRCCGGLFLYPGWDGT